MSTISKTSQTASLLQNMGVTETSILQGSLDAQGETMARQLIESFMATALAEMRPAGAAAQLGRPPGQWHAPESYVITES
jgi:hypothetical protein